MNQTKPIQSPPKTYPRQHSQLIREPGSGGGGGGRVGPGGEQVAQAVAGLGRDGEAELVL